jgi:geranylgeranyl diphosphate synthase type II
MNFLSQALKASKLETEEKIRDYLPLLGEKEVLRDACEYALLNGGKRFRPALVSLVAKALGSSVDVSYAGLAVECFHTASLVADDLPCMDNEEERRGKPVVHKVYNEATAILATYTLIAAGYDCIARAGEVLGASNESHSKKSDKITLEALKCVTDNTGILGASGGQHLDLFPPDYSEETIKEIIKRKTISLFEVSFVFGWLFGGGDSALLNDVKRLSYHFGMAFQIADDLGDIVQDGENGCQINMALVFGKERAKIIFKEHFEAYHTLLKKLKIDSLELKAIADYLKV